MRRARRNPTFDIKHADHGITGDQLSFIQDFLASSAPEGFFIRQIEIPSRLGPVPNALYGPESGDPPVPESKIFYAHRGDRPVADRMIHAAPRPCSYVQAIGIRKGDSFVIFTVYGGPLAPMHPDSPNHPDREGALRFWSKHALADQQWARMNAPRHAPMHEGASIGMCGSEEGQIVRWPRDITCGKCIKRLRSAWQDRQLYPDQIPMTRWPWEDDKPAKKNKGRPSFSKIPDLTPQTPYTVSFEEYPSLGRYQDNTEHVVEVYANSQEEALYEAIRKLEAQFDYGSLGYLDVAYVRSPTGSRMFTPISHLWKKS